MFAEWLINRPRSKNITWLNDKGQWGHLSAFLEMFDGDERQKLVAATTVPETATESVDTTVHVGETKTVELPAVSSDIKISGYETVTFAGVTVERPVYEDPSAVQDFLQQIDPDYTLADDNAKYIMKCLQSDSQVILSGPRGCGKTSLLRQVAAHIKYPMLVINFDGEIEKGQLIGRHTVKGKEVVWVDGLIIKAIKAGFWIVLDEYDAAPPSIQFVLQSVLDKGALVNLENNETVTKAKGCIFTGCMNSAGLGDETGMYGGLNVINAATLDRWEFQRRCHYPKPADEIALLRKRFPNITGEDIERLCQVAGEVREARRKTEVLYDMSVRRMIAACKHFETFGQWRDAIEESMCNFASDGDGSIIRELAQRHFGWS